MYNNFDAINPHPFMNAVTTCLLFDALICETYRNLFSYSVINRINGEVEVEWIREVLKMLRR